MGKKREVPEEVKQNRRTILSKSMAALAAAARDGDEETVNRIADEMEALKLLVRDENQELVTGPDVAD